MHILLGGTGHIGSAAAKALLDRGEPVTIVTRDRAKGAAWERQGARIAVCDVHDVPALRAVFQSGRRLLLINPPADPSTDTDAAEMRSIVAIVEALDGSRLEGIVAQSTYGAQPGKQIGDLGTLDALEDRLRLQPIPTTIVRAAYYMSNWDASLDGARTSGVIQTMNPRQLKIPMVAPADLGIHATELLIRGEPVNDLHSMEGPERYSAADVAAAFASALGREVRVETVPRDRWNETFKSLGFSDAAAESYTRMTAISVDGGYEMPDAPRRGPTSLRTYVADLVVRARR